MTKCCEKCLKKIGYFTKDHSPIMECLDPYDCPCHQPQQEDWETTPRWQIEAKYRAVLQIVMARNDWSNKYPLLESVIDGLLSSSRASLIEKVEEMKAGGDYTGEEWPKETEAEKDGWNSAIDGVITLLKQGK